VDIGEAGKHSDVGVLFNSAFGQTSGENTLCIPSPEPLPHNYTLLGTPNPPIPHTIVGDEAFPLHNNLSRPYLKQNLSGI